MQRTTTRGRCCLFRHEMQLYLPENWVQMLHTCSPKTGEQHLIKPWEHGRVRGSICTWKVNEDSFYYSWSQVTSALVLPQGATFAVGRRCLTSHHLAMGKTPCDLLQIISCQGQGREGHTASSCAICSTLHPDWEQSSFAGGYSG